MIFCIFFFRIVHPQCWSARSISVNCFRNEMLRFVSWIPGSYLGQVKENWGRNNDFHFTNFDKSQTHIRNQSREEININVGKKFSNECTCFLFENKTIRKRRPLPNPEESQDWKKFAQNLSKSRSSKSLMREFSEAFSFRRSIFCTPDMRQSLPLHGNEVAWERRHNFEKSSLSSQTRTDWRSTRNSWDKEVRLRESKAHW